MKIKCSKCDYEWETKSEMMFVTCPNCRLKIEKKDVHNIDERRLEDGKKRRI